MLTEQQVSEFFATSTNGDRAMEMITRMTSVKRWHMLDTTRTQTLAEHSMNVALLGWYIAHTCPDGYFMSPARAAVAGLLHDIEESVTGDIQSITKRILKDAVNEVERDLMPPEFKVEMDADTVLLTKMCDIADGIRFIRVYGNEVATKDFARRGLLAQLDRCHKMAVASWPPHVALHVDQKLSFYMYD